MKNQSSYFAGKPDASFLFVEKALSSLSYECASAIRCFYYCGLQDSSTCRHLMETQAVIDAAMNDLGAIQKPLSSPSCLAQTFNFKVKSKVEECD